MDIQSLYKKNDNNVQQINVIDNLLSSSATDALSANQGKVLKQNLDTLTEQISTLKTNIAESLKQSNDSIENTLG